VPVRCALLNSQPEAFTDILDTDAKLEIFVTSKPVDLLNLKLSTRFHRHDQHLGGRRCRTHGSLPRFRALWLGFLAL